MPQQDTSNIKEKIISTIKFKGPSLPVHISNATGQSMLFASAFLAELLSEKKLKISNMKVGSSPLYFLPGQEPQLEKFAQEHLKSKEKDAFILLKEKKFLEDSEQEPAIRVALRSIKDFATPFETGGKIIWRYYTIPESEFKKKKNSATQEQTIDKSSIDLTESQRKIQAKQDLEPNQSDERSEEHLSSEKENSQKEKPLNIFDKKSVKKKIARKKTKKQDDKFFNKVKEFLMKKGIEIIDIQNFNKNDLTLKIQENGNEKLIVAFNKRKIAEADLTKACKKAKEENLPYIVLSLGEPVKKLSNLIETIKKMEKIEVIE